MPALLRLRLLITLVATCSLVLMVSCASSRRMVRSSPFADESESNIRQTAKSGTDSSLKLARKTDNQLDLNVDQERVNFWPLVYRRPELFTILWPMADFDKNGMAIRPFYVKDGDEYSVIFPLAAWNPVNKDGWVLNTYWEKSFNGSFPLYHLGPKFNYVMPVWWTPDSVGFPGFCFARNSGLNYGGPFWYNSTSGSGGFFPLCYHESSNHGWFFPLYFYDKTTDTSIYLPLYGLAGHYSNSHGNKSLMVLIYCHYWTKDEKTVHDMLLPLYLYRRNDGWNTVLTLPFMYSTDSKSGDYWVNIMGPLYYRSLKGDNSFTSALCFLGGYSGSPERSTVWAMPFFYNEKDKTSEYMYIFPYYSVNIADCSKQIRMVIPFYRHKSSPEIDSLWLFPYYQCAEKDKPSSGAVFPLFYYGGEEKNLCIMPLLSNFSDKRLDILYPLIGYGYQNHSFRFMPLVSVNEECPSLLVNVDHDGFSFIGPFGFKYNRVNNDDFEKTEFRSLLFMFSSSEKRNMFFSQKHVTNMVESQQDFYFLYMRKAERNKVWNQDLIEQKDADIIAQKYNQYLSLNQTIKWYDESDKEIQNSSDKIKKERSERVAKYKKEQAETRIQLITAMQKYGMRAKCESEDDLMQEINKFDSKYTVLENEGNTIVLPLFFSGYKETPVKSNCIKPAFNKNGYSLLLPLYYSSYENKEYYTNILFFMAESTSRPNYSSFRVLRYLFHAEEQNDKYSYDIFPFISMRGSKDFSGYSFGWHLFDVRTEKQTGKRSGHILFIPF